MVRFDQAGPACVGRQEGEDESKMWLLPDEILLDLLRRLEVSDLCSIMQASLCLAQSIFHGLQPPRRRFNSVASI